MKSYRFYAMTFIILASLITMIIGCKYDVAEPLWNSPPANSTEVTITSIDPAAATPGVNIITINGTNLSSALDSTRITKRYNDTLVIYDSTFVYNGIYFDNVQATVISSSPTMIKVFRPNVVSNNCTIKIASDKALAVAKFGPYKIDAVMEPFGSFVANVPLSSISLDNAGNLYVAETNTQYLWKITPNGDKTQIMTETGGSTALVMKAVSSDLKISPVDGKLYYTTSIFPKTKYVQIMDLNSPTVKMDSIALTKNVICCDFAANGYLYAGGRRSGIQIIRPDRSLRNDGYYATDTISSMRVFKGYVYVSTRHGIWRHSLSDTSLVGAPELVLDLTQGMLASLPVKAISFSADGNKLYIGTDSQYPILVADATSLPIPLSKVDIVYKGILPSYCKQFCFGNYIYAIIGNAIPAVNWLVYKIDVGVTGAPYY